MPAVGLLSTEAEDMIYYVDIDGTLTDEPDKPNGKPIAARIARVKRLIGDPENIVHIWSSRGFAYAQDFCNRNGIYPHKILPKPDVCIDDLPGLRPKGKLKIVNPKDFFGG